MNALDLYAQAIVGGAPAGKYHQLSCARHLRDRAREATPDFPYRFDLEKSERFFRFAEKLKHYKGEQWAGQTIVLQPYQKFRLGSLFGWVHVVSGLRRFRTSYNEIPRKNGKSLEAAIVLLYGTFYDGEAGAEGYTIAVKRDQAKLVFNDAKQLVQSSGLKSRIKVLVANLHREDTASKAEPLGADHDSTDGLNPSIYIVDEMHAYKDRGLIDVMETATGARLQPIGFQITTAGDDLVSPCGDQHEYACKILDGVLIDETFFAFIAHADVEDDWLDERTWAKANPNYGVSVIPDDMRSLATKAKNMPSAAATFKQKRLNLWVNASEPWLSMDGFRRGQSSWDPGEMRGESCYLAIDLASKIDLCALACLFPPTDQRKAWRYLIFAWTPEETLIERARRDRAPYTIWAEQGHLIAVPGTAVGHAVVRAKINELRELYTVEQVGFDPWHARELINALVDEDGLAVERAIEIPQTYAGMSSACRDFEAEVLEGLVDTGGNPLAAWSASNVIVQRDGKDNLYPVKKKSRGRIDPIVASLIARRIAALRPDESSSEASRDFEARGLFV